jgi:hypothetical protein
LLPAVENGLLVGKRLYIMWKQAQASQLACDFRMIMYRRCHSTGENRFYLKEHDLVD